MEQKKFLETYEVPVVEIVEVQVERGFASSGDPYTNTDEEVDW